MLTFVALHLMNVAQPALLYLVPVILIAALLTGVLRRELGMLWRGDVWKPEVGVCFSECN